MYNLLGKHAVGLVVGLAYVLSIQINQGADQHQIETDVRFCDRQQAILLVQQQVSDAGTIDNPVWRIAILIRAADSLWAYQQDSARGIFNQAYGLAEKQFMEKGDETRKEGRLGIALEDQRFVVMSAIARRDAAWARRLAERAAEATRLEAEKELASPVNRISVVDKMISLAASLLSADQQVAIKLVRSTFRYPGTEDLASFLFKLAETNQQAADQLYQEAINAYGNATARELLYLSAYPFALNRVIGPEAFSIGLSSPPQSFVANPGLQRLFLETLFRRAEASISTSEQAGGGNRPLPDSAQIYVALSGAESLIAQYQPGYQERAATLKALVAASLSSDVRQLTTGMIHNQTSHKESSLEGYVSKAGLEANPAKRDQWLTFAVLEAPDSEPLDRLRDLAQKISDSRVQQQLRNWLYFKRAQKAIRDGLLFDARSLAEKVDQLDHRAYLFYEIAAEALRGRDDRALARETLDAVAAAALKAENTNEKARTLLGVVYLYTKFDRISAFEKMSYAVKTINKIAEPDLTSTRFHQRIEGQTFAHYSMYEVAGFSLEKTFRELGPSDFEGALLLAKMLEDQSLRSRGVIALAAFCLEKLESEEKRIIRPPRFPRETTTPSVMPSRETNKQ